MKVFKFVLLGLMLVTVMGVPALANPVNVLEYPSGYFAPSATTSAPYYRWYNEDWSWTHGAVDPVEAGKNATLWISAFDVDAPSEVDNIYAYDNQTAAWVMLGSLLGNNNAWGYTTFVLLDDVLRRSHDRSPGEDRHRQHQQLQQLGRDAGQVGADG